MPERGIDGSRRGIPDQCTISTGRSQINDIALKSVIPDQVSRRRGDLPEPVIPDFLQGTKATPDPDLINLSIEKVRRDRIRPDPE